MKPEDGEPLYLYMVVSSTLVSSVLVKEIEGQQNPIYYIRKSLIDAETRYSHLEKLILALVMASTKLRHFFETHAIHVRTNYPIKCVLRKPEVSGRMAKWSVKLSAFNLIYEPRTAIKSQALADFVADFSTDLQSDVDLEVKMLEESTEKWTLHTDGASNVQGIGLGIVLKSPQGDIIPQAVNCHFIATNNEAEYEALISGMQLAKDMNIRNLKVYVDSLLLANHFNGTYAAKENFDLFDIEQAPREENTEADALANLGSTLKMSLGTKIPIVHILQPAIGTKSAKILAIEGTKIDQPENNRNSWTTPIIEYLNTGTIPKDEHPKNFRMKSTHYSMINGTLYRRSLAGSYLRCLEYPETTEVLKDIHESECGNHTAGRSLYSKILRTGYNWPTMKQDAEEYSKKYDACQ
uniref:uncharacterized protein LOC122601106 n=1 Tax=Erigeron canadensis TaxID=72917 RepID=UPI001CB9A68A|nr:uncharacterized protein LOC122601106 [Erigeron canadensis]